MTVTGIKTITFDQAMKVFTKFVSKSETRPVLQCVYNDGEYLYATDGAKLLRVKKEFISDIPEFTLFNPKNMTVVNDKMNFPECSRLIPNNFNSTVTLNDNIKELHKHVKEIKKIVKKNRNHVMKMEFTRNETKVSAKNENDSYSENINTMWADDQEITLSLSANFLEIAIDTIKKLSKVSYNKVELGLVSHVRPMLFKQDGVFDIIISPVRIV